MRIYVILQFILDFAGNALVFLQPAEESFVDFIEINQKVEYFHRN